jgi:predicted Zn-dependent protease
LVTQTLSALDSMVPDAKEPEAAKVRTARHAYTHALRIWTAGGV